jgi:hypothetical protein
VYQAMNIKPENTAETVAFDVYFASIRSMQFHPGAGTREHVRLTAKECADAALEMLAVRREIMQEEH